MEDTIIEPVVETAEETTEVVVEEGTPEEVVVEEQA
jgi:hypothetical protein